jgi:hypothetical protein
MGPGTGLDDVKKRKILPLPGFNSVPSALQPVASRYTDCAIPSLDLWAMNKDHPGVE